MHVSITQLLLILVIVIVLFGTKKLRNVGADLGGAIKSFKTAMKEGEEEVTVESETMILKLQNLKIEIKEVDDEEVAQEKRITKSKLGTF